MAAFGNENELDCPGRNIIACLFAVIIYDQSILHALTQEIIKTSLLSVMLAIKSTPVKFFVVCD